MAEPTTEARLTRNQTEVITCLRGADRPLTAYEILARLKGRGITAPTTIYRALERLTEDGLVHRVESTNAFAPCSQVGAGHEAAFIVCADCGRAIETDLAQSLATLKRDAERAGFKVSKVTVELIGRCTECRSA